jgi:hypothetical protein
MTSYAVSTLLGRVVGFLDSVTMPVMADPAFIAHALVERVAHWPTAESPTAELWIENGVLRWHDPATLDQRRAALADEISFACRAHIEQGFVCTALGGPFLYPAKAQDQANLNGSVTDSLLFTEDPDWVTPFWCADEAGAWDFRMHTRAQIQQVGRAGKASILAAMQKNELLQRQIAAASAEQLPAITW